MRQTTIVAVLQDPPQWAGIAVGADREVDWLELRADSAGDVDADWLRAQFAGSLLYSLRGRGPERAARLLRAARTFDLVALEPEDLTVDLLQAVPPERRVISAELDSVDADELRGIATAMTRFPARLYRIAIDADESGDELLAPQLLRELGRDDVTAFATGPAGLWTRILAPWLGAPVVFGAAGADDPEQGLPSVARLIGNFGFPDLPEVHELFGMAGDPVMHSLSPRVHNITYRTLGRAALYLPFHVRDFEKFWTRVATSGALDALGFPLHGLSVVSPHKSTAIASARHSSELVQHALSANLFRRNGGGHWRAETTDAHGIMFTLRERGVQPRGKRVAVVGCGGSGRAMAAALHEAGAEVTLVNRGEERGSLAVNLLHLPFVPLADFTCDGYSIVVNATPVGRDGVTMPFPVQRLRRDAVVVDLVYRDGATPLIEQTRGGDRITIDGWDMLVAQARHQFELMTGLEMPDELIRQTLGLEAAVTVTAQ
ncbi:MAG TPA: shikimate dehydrogenase [Thermoanaerobaculia bacterium]|jgi:3-dehydroquinate dehydratase/shikimate dehydrogenase